MKPCDELAFNERLRAAAGWREKDPQYGTCRRCHLPWTAVTDRAVAYEPRRGGFAICKSCWRELGTPEARLPFYLMLASWWATQSDVDIDDLNQKFTDAVYRESADELAAAHV